MSDVFQVGEPVGYFQIDIPDEMQDLIEGASVELVAQEQDIQRRVMEGVAAIVVNPETNRFVAQGTIPGTETTFPGLFKAIMTVRKEGAHLLLPIIETLEFEVEEARVAELQ